MKREAYIKYKEYIDTTYIKDNFVELYYIYKVVNDLHAAHEKDFSLDELIAAFSVTYPDAKKDTYDPLFQQIAAAEISDEVGADILRKIRQRKMLLELSEKAFNATQGRVELPELSALVEAIRGDDSVAEEASEFVTDDLETLVRDVIQKPGLRWRLNCLNKSLGSLRKGDFGFIFARPETGKTTFLASEASHMLEQTDSPILWFNNEEQGEKVMLRVYQAFFGVPIHEILAHVPQYKAEFKRRVGGRFLLVDDATLDRTKAERVIERARPGLIIYDQIDKIRGFKADRDDLVYGEIYQWGRELAKAYAPSIGVSQAAGTGEGIRYLTMEHVANAKTSKQAEADFILGIGKTSDEASQYIRYLSISKNKLFGDEDSNPNLKHARFEVLIEPQIARYKDIVNFD